MNSWRSSSENGNNSPGPSRSSGMRQTSSPGSHTSQNAGAAGVNPEYCETIASMLSRLSCNDQANAILAITNSPETCLALRKAGCIPLLIQILHPTNLTKDSQPTVETKNRAARALKNIVLFNNDEKVKRSELRVLKFLESIRAYSELLKNGKDDGEKHPVQSSTTLMKLSFDEEHRNTMCLLGGIHTLADLIQTDYSAHGINQNTDCVIVRRYSGMTLTNLTFGDGANKALLCSMKDFMSALVAQLDSQNEDICQVTASVLRNLSWHADSSSRAALRDSEVVTKLISAAIKSTKESTLKATLSALWNLSAHSVANKTAICRSPNAINFLIDLLNYKSKTLTIVENAGGILRNVSTTIAVNGDETRSAFRSCGLLEILLSQLKSSSLTVVSNACGMLWHLTTNCEEDQQRLLELGAVPKLKALMYSKHDRIAQGASAALKNLLNYAWEQNAPPSPFTDSSTQHPMDLRTSTTETHVETTSKPPVHLVFQDEPLDLSLHSTKSSPIHVVSALEFGARPNKLTPAFLNPPLQDSSAWKYSPKNYNSCPEFARYPIPPAHKSVAIDFSSNAKTENNVEDTTINYSQHYTESTDECQGQKSEDTVKTYYCEGTPLNFSTSNSMSDLTQVDKQVKLKPIVENVGELDLPRKYCTEHTPATFSRASSLSSIASNIQGGEYKAEYFEETTQNISTSHNGDIVKERVKRNVTFSANETPLMFSRSSSINSLESVEITYEDAGSVVSEFSVRPSEVVSPSDLPDSPRQKCAPEQNSHFGEKPQKVIGSEHGEDTLKHFNSCESGAVSGVLSVRSLSPLMVDGELVGVKINLDSDPSPATKQPAKPTVPEELQETPAAHAGDSDEVVPRIFAVEGTPFGASNATSLSDLMGELDREDEKASTCQELELEPKMDPLPLAPPDDDSEPIYSDAQMLQKCIKAGKAARIPKSKSELSKLNAKTAIKPSQSYHESFKPQPYIDPKLTALIQEGKNRARGRRPQKIVDDAPPAVQVVSEIEPKMTKSVPVFKKMENAVSILKESVQSCNQRSTTSIASEWNDDTATISSQIPSMSISTAFRIVEMKSEGPRCELKEREEDLTVQSTLSKIEPPSNLSALESFSSVEGRINAATESSNLLNQKPPAEFDLESSMMSVASLKSEVASVALLETGMNDLSIGGETYTIGGGGSDGDAVTDADDSLIEELNSFEEVMIPDKPKEEPPPSSPKFSNTQNTPPDRFLTFTKRHLSPRQRRREDPSRYLTRTISPHDSNGNFSITALNAQFATFRVDKSPRIITKQISATSNESSPTGSPKGIRGRRKHLYASLPQQRKIAPPIPPKPSLPPSSGGVYVRPTRTSALRAAVASSHDSSSKNSSKNSSSTSLNNYVQPSNSSAGTRKIPPKPPARTSLSSPSKNFAVVRAVRNSNSSIGFGNETKSMEAAYNTLPRSGTMKAISSEPSKVSNIGKLSNLWNQLTKSKTDNSCKNGQSSSTEQGLDKSSPSTEKKPSKFGFSFGKKKKNVWLKREELGSAVKEKVEREKAFVLPFNYTNRNSQPEPPSGAGGGNSRMTTV